MLFCERCLERLNEPFVFFSGNDALCVCGKRECDRAKPRADLKDRILRCERGSHNYFFYNSFICKEILSQPFVCGYFHLFSACDHLCDRRCVLEILPEK